jgi:P-type E1-E2 ATPase
VFVFREDLRPETREAIALLRRQGLGVAVLTGDLAGRGAALVRELGVPVAAELLPEDKVTALAKARQAFGPVAMVGDVIIDAPALAARDVGVALGCGADVSRDAATVCLLGNDLCRLPWAIGLARRTVGAIRRNLFWAFAYNGLGIGLAVSGYLNHVWAALALVLSNLFVVSNSLRLGNMAEETAP